MTRTNAFQTIPLLRDLPESERTHLLSVVKDLSLEPGEILFREDEPGATLYLVREGSLDVVKGLGTSDERTVANNGPGEFIGEMSLFIPGRARTASIRAVERSVLWTMTHQAFSNLLIHQPRLAYAMVQVVSKRLDESNAAAFRDLQERNRRLQQAYDELKSAQARLIEKERIERELQVAAQIQVSILPQTLPEVSGFAFGALMQPARVVGGDLYDVFMIDADHVGLVVGDVVGKGVPAAIFMARSHALIMAESIHGGSPADILRRVNSHLMQLQQSDQFVTVLYGILEVATGRLSYARAGHELPILVTMDGSVRTLPQQPGQPLGLFDEVVLDENSLLIPPGATLLLNTDGLTDCRNPQGTRFEYERTEKVLGGLVGQSGQQVCRALLEKLMEFQAAAEQDDDITLVAVHRIGA